MAQWNRLLSLGCVIVAILGLVGESTSESIAQTQPVCSVSFSLNPTTGSTAPGGSTNFDIRGAASGPCAWAYRLSLAQTRTGITMTFSPASGVIPPNSSASSRATASVASTVPAAIYELTIRIDLIRIFGERQDPMPPVFKIYTLHVLGAPRVPDIDVSPTSINFGAVPIGTTATRLLTIRNVGQADLFISSAAIQGGTASPFHLGGRVFSGITVRSGQAMTIEIFFAPRGSGAFQDTLVIRSNDPDEPTVTIALSGRTPEATRITATIKTDQGCLEKGEEAIYYLGEPILVSFRVDGIEHALVRIFDITTEGTKLLVQQTVPGNRDLSFTGVATLPLGLDTLLLQVFIGSVVATEASCSFFVQDAPKPDLHTTEVDAPKEAEEGAEITVTNTVRNTVTRGITGGDAGKFRVGIYFSKDKDFSADDRLLGSRDVAGLKRDTSSKDKTKITLPKDLVPEGSDSLDGFILVVADDQKTVDEQNEENNVKSAKDKAKAVKLTAAPAEIAVTPDKAEFTIHVGTSKEEKFTIINMGKKTLKIEEPSAKAPFTAQIDKKELKPKETATLTVRFSPNQVGKVKEADAKVTIKSNAKNKPVLEIPVPAEATNTAPKIDLSPRSGDGVYAVATEKTLKITAQASDPDIHAGRETGEPDKVTVKVVGLLPDGAVFDGKVLTFATKKEQAGKDFEITFEAEDEHGAKTPQKITVKVRKPDPIPWNPAWDANYPNIPVTWDDFLGDIPANAPANRDAETSYIPPQPGFPSTSFLRDSSWVRPESRDSDLLLEHERGHLAIAEIFVRRYNAAADADKKDVLNEHNRIQALYDAQTLPSGEGKKKCQQAWSQEMQKALTGQAGAMPSGWNGPTGC